MTKLFAPDGVEIQRTGQRPESGGVRGTPAEDVQGNLRCVACLSRLPEDHGRSPYCMECRNEAKKRAARKRNAKRRSASESRRTLRADVHWEGSGYTYGRSGLYIERTLLNGIREALAVSLSDYALWQDAASGPYDLTRSRQYHQALNQMLLSIRDLNEWLKGPFWPHTDNRGRRHDDGDSG